MKATSHKIIHQYQPTPTTCSQTAFSTLLGHYGLDLKPLEIEQKVPQVKDAKGNDSGTITQQLATWAAAHNFEVTMYTFDCQIIDQTWQDLSPSDISTKLEAAVEYGWTPPGLGEEWSRAYRQAYIDFINAKGKLVIQPAATSNLIYKLLGDGPVFATISINTLYGFGKTNDGDAGFDDIRGRTWNHSIVIYGNDANGNFLVADPIVKPGLHAIEPERMTAGITAAQVECDNLIFQITPQ